MALPVRSAVGHWHTAPRTVPSTATTRDLTLAAASSLTAVPTRCWGSGRHPRPGPDQAVRAMCDHLRPLLRRKYPRATLKVTKRAILIEIDEPLPSGEDPTVDLVVPLDHRDNPGLWIPNTAHHRWDWDPSHPEARTPTATTPTREPGPLRLPAAGNPRPDPTRRRRRSGPPNLAWQGRRDAGPGHQALASGADHRDRRHRAVPDSAASP
jgi:hypothetical protein